MERLAIDSIILPYWQRDRRALWQLLALALLSIVGSGLLIWETFPKGEVISALGARDGDRFGRSLVQVLIVVLLMIPVQASKVYLQGRLALRWRRWLTKRVLGQYFTDRAFYAINQTGSIDHPDQRIAEDIRNVTQQVLTLAVLLLDAGVQLLGFGGVLWQISPLLLLALVLYALTATGLIAGWFGPILARLNFVQLQREADFRFSLIRVREAAEGIAFYQGEATVGQRLHDRLQAVLANFQRLITWQFNLSLGQNFYLFLGFFLPFLVLFPQIRSGQLEIGAIQQSQAAFERVGYVLGIVLYQMEQLSQLAAGSDRLVGLLAVLPSGTVLPSGRILPGDGVGASDAVAFDCRSLTLLTPDRQTTLLQDFDLTIKPGESLLITGASGVGKTSLLRALLGLWPIAAGEILRPAVDRVLFLPQRPYLMLGSLRQQLQYPSGRVCTDDDLWRSLNQVKLADRLDDWGGFEAVQDWAKILSGGEQQRLAWARLWLHQPDYVFLDEASSALDEPIEAQLYAQLQQLPLTYISVGHRSSLRTYHDWVLTLDGQSGTRQRGDRL